MKYPVIVPANYKQKLILNYYENHLSILITQHNVEKLISIIPHALNDTFR